MTNMTSSSKAITNNFPPNVKLPSFIQTVELAFRPLQFLEAARKRYGDIFVIRTTYFPAPLVVVSHPQAVRELFTADQGLFETKTGESIWIGDLIEEDGISMLESGKSSDHSYLRNILGSYFPGERMESYGQIIRKVTTDEIRKVPIGQPFWVYPYLQKNIYRILIEIFFGNKEEQDYEQFQQTLVKIISFYQSSWGFISLILPFSKKLSDWIGLDSPWKKFYVQKEILNKIISAEIEQRQIRQCSDSQDLLSILMSIYNKEGQLITDTSLKAQLKTLMVGNDAVAAILAWSLYWIYRIPEVYRKLMAEIDSLGSDLNIMEIMKLPYLNAVCAETLRMHCPDIGVHKRLKVPFQIGGYQLEPGTMLVTANYLTHHQEDLYPEPKRFQPERFLERKFSTYEY